MLGRVVLGRLSRRGLLPSSQSWVAATTTRGASQAAGKEEEDIVVSVFKEEQQKFRSFIAAAKDIPIPMSADEAAVASYHKKIQDIKAKLGIPSDTERIHNTMEYQMSSANEDVRTFVQSMEGMLGEEAFNDILDAVDKVESETGYALTIGDNPPFKKFMEAMKGVLEANGVSADADPNKVAMEAEIARIKALSAEAQEEMDSVKTKHGLGFIDVNAADLKPTTA